MGSFRQIITKFSQEWTYEFSDSNEYQRVYLMILNGEEYERGLFNPGFWVRHKDVNLAQALLFY